jgi:rhodanese-related sulfurtransferase
MASQNPEIAEALAYFRAKKRAYASPMDVAHALREGSTSICIVDVRNPVAPIPTTIKGAVWIPEREIVHRLEELPRDRTIVLVCWDVWCSLATLAAIPLLENGFVAKELNGGIKAWQTLHLPEVALNAGPQVQP